ncbi:hypothetical protein VPNG_01584 [Cytospora leucostoma]|uniref:Transcription factor IIIC 90kDa subunit N-terminal domain-containing protein n=1 Tax=Cytospora leucostoma TaxID=1230097 RepID=A0A423XJU4_9PEZI|nr:hypothetical protein VPNG_01584 [Cytospora leucostoma]
MNAHYISQILPLRGLNLKSKPLNQRAIAWSCDAELAVAADDSVYVCLPQFPILDPNAGDDEYEDEAESDIKSEPEEDDGNMGFLSSRLPKQYGDDDDDDSEYDDRLEEDSEDDDIEPGEHRTGGQHNNNASQPAGTRGAHSDPAANALDPRQQFLDGMRRIPVSYPHLFPDLNAHIWEAAGRDIPLIHTTARDDRDRDRDRGVTSTIDAMPKDNEEEEEEAEYRDAGDVIAFHDAGHHPGAGVGVIGSSGTSLNHVVAVEWSPPGIGKNGRPVLAVLTGCGSLAVYGEGCPLPFGNTARPLRGAATKGAGAARDLATWNVLWAVGENFVVPGQEEYGYGEFVRAFAWSQGAGAGRALLGYVNDQREVVVLCVGAEYGKSREEGLDEAVWNVREVCRFEAEGPHAQQDPMDPDFVPGGSSFCVRWSPWIKGEESWTCVLSYMDRNYVGFRRITVDVPTWKPTEPPVISLDPHDWDGRCIHLGADAFVEFENTIWTVGDREICRGFIATPLVAEPFEVNLAQSDAHMPRPSHSTDHCGTTYDDHGSVTNPITGLIVHPVGLQTVSPSLVPFYTAVRLSATATNPGWWESNVARQGDEGKIPQWVAEIQDRITTVTPLGLAGLSAGGDDGEVDLVDGVDGAEQVVEEEEEEGQQQEAQQRDGEEEWDTDDDEDSDDDDDDDDDDVDAQPGYEGPDVHPLRMRIWGLAVSPGGGTTAVLASQQLTQGPERGGWHTHRSAVLFGHEETRRRRGGGRGRKAHGGDGDGDDIGKMDLDVDDDDDEEEEEEEEAGSAVNVDGLSTEARLWEWMYGGGPGVPGLTYYPEPEDYGGEDYEDDDDDNNDNGINNHQDRNRNRNKIDDPARAQRSRDALAQVRRDMIRAVFKSSVREQTCSICADGVARFPADDFGDEVAGSRRRLDCACERGHRVALCGASGLAIMEPGISRCCGVCRSRCLDVDVLVGRVLLPAGRGEDAEMVREEVTGEVCVRCGGKYLD